MRDRVRGVPSAEQQTANPASPRQSSRPKPNADWPWSSLASNGDRSGKERAVSFTKVTSSRL